MIVERCQTNFGEDKPGTPDISVIIASYNAVLTVTRCIESLTRQSRARNFEIILIDSSSDGTDELVRSRFPFVQLHHFHDRQFCGEARNWGMKQARAPIIAFLDADCFVRPDWIEAIWEAHQYPGWVVGGAIDNGSPNSLLAWAYYFCEFSLWLPRATKREMEEIAGCCLSFKRVAYDTFGPFIEGTYCSDTAFHWKLRREGYKVIIHPAIRVYHTISCSFLEFLAHIFEHRRSYARVSRWGDRYSSSRRFGLAILSLGIPLPLLLCVAWRVICARIYRGRFLLAVPLIGAGLLARAVGEFWGYMFDCPHTSSSKAIRL